MRTRQQSLVTFESAKMLAGLGFDLPAFNIWQDNNGAKELRPHQKTPVYQSELGGFEDCGINEYLAPNIEDALFWLQEHGYSVSGAYCYSDKSYFYMVQYLRAEDADTGCGFSEKPGFPTYEEAVSAGIEAALGILTEDKKERK